MERLRAYCLTVRCIDGVETYIISAERCAAFAADQELIEALTKGSWVKRRVLNLIQTAHEFDVLYLAFAHHRDRAGVDLAWEPVLCYREGDAFFHAMYRDSWMCRACGHILYAPILMPMCEGEPDLYYGTENRFPDIPPCFRKVPCPKCGRPLQNHLIVLR